MNIADFKNKHPGEPCWIIGNGPSLNKMDLSFLNGKVSIGVNSIFLGFEKFGFVPPYYTLEDPYVAEDNADAINGLGGPMVKFYPRDLDYCLTDRDNVCWINFVRDYRGEMTFPEFSTDCAEAVYWGSTVTYLSMQLAYYMGCNPVYLIGVDFDYQVPDYIENDTVLSREDDVNHFHPDYFGVGKRWHHPHLEKVAVAYEYCRDFYAANNREIYNAGVGGKLEIFPRIDYLTVSDK